MRKQILAEAAKMREEENSRKEAEKLQDQYTE
jgi:hypothetical protein